MDGAATERNAARRARFRLETGGDMDATESLQEVVFALGQLGTNQASNGAVLEQIGWLLARGVGAEATSVSVHEQGFEAPASAWVVLGPWPRHEARRMVEPPMSHLANVERGRLHRLGEITEDRHESLNIADHALIVVRRGDATELLLTISALGGRKLSDEQLQRFAQLTQFAARAWVVAWRREPEWAVELKPPCRSVLEMVIEGLDDDQIASRTGLSYHAVRAHLKRLFRAAGVRSRLHLMQAYREECAGRQFDASDGESDNGAGTGPSPALPVQYAQAC